MHKKRKKRKGHNCIFKSDGKKMGPLIFHPNSTHKISRSYLYAKCVKWMEEGTDE